MKIVLLIYSLGGGGAERVSTILMNRWQRAGHEVTLLTLSGDSVECYALDTGIRRVALGLDQVSGNAVGAAFNNLRRVWRLRAALRALQPDVTLAMMATSAILLGLAGGPGIRLGSERAHPPAQPLGRVWEWLRRKAYPHLHAVVAQTSESAQWLRMHTGARRVVIIQNPLEWPLPRLQPVLAPAQVLAPSRRVLLAVGRLAREKQFEHTLQAFARLAPTHAEWDLVVLGEGTERASLEALILSLGLSGRTHLPGRVGNLGDWYARAELYVMSSRYEGFPNTLMEALASGLPAVSYDCDTGPRDLIQPGLNGEIVAPQDLDGLVHMLHTLMVDPARRAAMRRHCEPLRERFSERQVGAQWDALLAPPGRLA